MRIQGASLLCRALYCSRMQPLPVQILGCIVQVGALPLRSVALAHEDVLLETGRSLEDRYRDGSKSAAVTGARRWCLVET